MFCNRCKNPEAEFYSWLKSYCKKCEKQRHKNRYGLRDRNRENKLRRDSYDPIKQAEIYRFYNHGITQKQYEYMLNQQQNRCYLCENVTKLCIDHDHTQCNHLVKRKSYSECIRGLLCSECNRRHLPWAEKNERLQSQAIKKYLARRPLCSSHTE